MNCTVRVESDKFGGEDFGYINLEEARLGMSRLKKSCQKEANRDGVVRRLSLVVDYVEISREGV